MRNHVSFFSTRFQSHITDPERTNSSDYGEDLAAWLLAQVRLLASQTMPFTFNDAPIQEDYGYGFWVGSDIWVAVGIMDDSIGADNAEWVVSVAYDPGLNLKKRLFGKPDRSFQLQICQALHAALTAAPDITEIRWCDDGEKDCADTPA